jgi:hypothetical protein
MQSEKDLRAHLARIARASLAGDSINERGCWRCNLLTQQQSHFFYCLAGVLQFDRTDHESIVHWLERAAALDGCFSHERMALARAAAVLLPDEERAVLEEALAGLQLAQIAAECGSRPRWPMKAAVRKQKEKKWTRTKSKK